MNSIKSITIFCPSVKGGGTPFLYGRIAKYIKLNSNYELSVIDFEDGFIKQFLQQNNIVFRDILFKPDEANIIEEPTILIIDLLTSKLLGKLIQVNKKSCLLLVCTFPFDGFKYIPTATMVYKWSKENKRNWGLFLHPLYRRKVRRFLDLATVKNGLGYMDMENYEANQYIFDLKNQPTILPIFTEPPINKKALFSNGNHFNIVWVGRLTDFKHLPVCAIMDTLELLQQQNGNRFTFHIVGDGQHFDIVKEYSARLKNIEVIFYGHLAESEVNDLLLKNGDVAIGHGTSILEAAKLGVPALLVNGAYFKPEVKDLKAIWLYKAENYFVGRIATKPDEFIGVKILDILKDLTAKSLQSIGDKCYDYWNEHHNIEKIGSKYLTMLDNGSFTYEDYLRTGIKKLGLLGSVAQGVKNVISRYKK